MAHLCATVDENLTGGERVMHRNTLRNMCNVEGSGRAYGFPAEEPVRLDLQM